MPTSIVALSIPNTPTIILRKGCDILLGRSRDAQIQFIDPTVSRMHAHIRWTDTEFPVITDNNSTAGLKVDDQYVSRKHLCGQHTVSLGKYAFDTTYYADKAALPHRMRSGGVKIFPKLSTQYEKDNFFKEAVKSTNALLDDIDEADGVILFTNYKKADERGRLVSNQQIQKLLSHIENKRYTGTLTLTSDLKAVIIFAAGRIIQASCGHLQDMRAVQHVSTWKHANYHFSYSVNVGEARLDVRPTQYFKKLETSKFNKKKISQRYGFNNKTTIDINKQT